MLELSLILQPCFYLYGMHSINPLLLRENLFGLPSDHHHQGKRHLLLDRPVQGWPNIISLGSYCSSFLKNRGVRVLCRLNLSCRIQMFRTLGSYPLRLFDLVLWLVSGLSWHHFRRYFNALIGKQELILFFC